MTDTDEINAIAKAIHDGPSAVLELKTMGMNLHAWEDCPHKKTYLGDAGAVIAAGFHRQSPVTDAEVEAVTRRAFPHYWDGTFEDTLANLTMFTPAQALESTEKKRDEKLSLTRRILEAARKADQ